MATIREKRANDGDTRYHVQVRLRGHPPATATFRRRTDAKKWAADTESAIRDGRYFKQAAARRHTLSELVERYIESVLPTKGAVADNQRYQLLWWKDELGDYTLADITADRIAECRDKLLNVPTKRGQTRGAATVVRYLAALSHAFTIARKEWRWVDSNPVKDIRKPTEPRGRVRFLSDDERARLLAACRRSKNDHLYPIVVLALSTGMRQGEILGLRWQDVDLTRDRVTLHDTKNGERRVVPLVHHAMDIMREHAKVRHLHTDWVFPGKLHGTRKNGKPFFPRDTWNNSLKRADIDNFRFHDLRHSAASYLAMNGASMAEIAEVLGHKTLQMVKRYAHLSEAHTTGVVASMNEKIFGQSKV